MCCGWGLVYDLCSDVVDYFWFYVSWFGVVGW